MTGIASLRLTAVRLWLGVSLAGCQAGATSLQSAPSPAKGPGEYPDESIRVGTQTRRYRLVVPEGLRGSAPLLIALHGMAIDSKDRMPAYTKLSDLARSERFVLVYPQAVGGSWGLSAKKIRDDLALFDALVAALGTSQNIDSRRIYVVGMSNGGYFAHLIGRERSTTVAAVASHSGPLGLQTLLGIRAKRKFPAMIIHGDQDRLFPIAFARENRDKYTKEGHPVEYVELPGLGHEWGTKANVNQAIWRFFAAHPR